MGWPTLSTDSEESNKTIIRLDNMREEMRMVDEIQQYHLRKNEEKSITQSISKTLSEESTDWNKLSSKQKELVLDLISEMACNNK